MIHIVDIKTCHPKRHVKHHQTWWARCWECGLISEPSHSEETVKRESEEHRKKFYGDNSQEQALQ